MSHVLVVADDSDSSAALAQSIELGEREIDVMVGGQTAQALLAAKSVDLVVVDANLNSLRGVDLCDALRVDGYTGGVILLAAANTAIDRVLALDAGADDYLSRLAPLAELRARVNAVLRRTHRWQDDPVRSAAELRVHPVLPMFTYRSTTASLGKREYPLLSMLLQCPGRAVTHEDLARTAWPEETHVSIATMSVAIRRLRAKLQNHGVPYEIMSVRGSGYLIATPPTVASA